MQNNNSGVPVELAAEQPTAPEPSSIRSQARGEFDLGKKRRSGPKKTKFWMIIAGVAAALVIGLVILWSVVFSMMSDGSAVIDESAVTADTTLKPLSSSDEAMAVMTASKARQIAEEEEARRKALEIKQAAPAAPEKTPPPPAPARSAAASNSAAPQGPTPAQRKLGGGVMVKATVAPGSSYGQSATGNGSSQAPGVVDSADLLGALPNSSGSSRGRGSLGDLSSTGFKTSKATLAPNGKYLLRHNTYARCALYTEIITDNPGLIECRLTEPLYSADGSTVLAEAGASLTGEQRVEVGPGQTSVFTAWTELETNSGVPGVPGVRAKLDSLGAGPMGRSGTKAWIDDHTFERYSGAVMLSGFQDILSAVSNATTKSSDSGYTVNNSEQNVENMASKALDANMNIPRTGYLLPGTVLTVIVARDIDFSSVFENR
ncbi:TrbI/VirB10 family protein [Serratia proteamaculans]|uniref:TrbI/VirB10 family protein n=1 Tax=Serratia proteamaculans TaxID=28151 RepID=UPI003CFC5150